MMLSAIDLHSRFGLFLSERVLRQSSFAQFDYSLCTYSQTTANGIAGAINASLSKVAQSLTQHYSCHTPRSTYVISAGKMMCVGSVSNALPPFSGRFSGTCPRTVLTSLLVYGSPLNSLNLLCMILNYFVTRFTYSQSLSPLLNHDGIPG